MAGYPRYFYPRPPRGGRPEFPVRNANREIISIHALREEGDRAGLPESAGRKDFYPRPPRGGRRQAVLRRMRPPDISIHALREEGDKIPSQTIDVRLDFYPRPPRGGRRAGISKPPMLQTISIHALREEGDADGCSAECAVLVFLSTPSARRATEALANYRQMNEEDFYPRPPRGGRQLTTASWQKARLFLSTPSARRATTLELSFYLTFQNFYPRPPRGGRRLFSSTSTQTGRISIHALREEGDLDPSQSLRGVRISIHALREEGDLPEKDRQAVRSISIHALREEGDTKSPHTSFWLSIFLSTPSARRATQKVAELTKRYNISIHALREEGDHGDLCYIMPHDNFYPRPPRGGRRCLTA